MQVWSGTGSAYGKQLVCWQQYEIAETPQTPAMVFRTLLVTMTVMTSELSNPDICNARPTWQPILMMQISNPGAFMISHHCHHKPYL
jgi:hypothetical protein